ncbi:THUMP domain-containing protein 3 [Triplophysa rosa]|uniref:THUMP domain-containing protein 3 n=1 Tax=Triplophysa rosa TaxID=992332 RepID=A0A9W7WS59_TRIRA|nr:THUMP domain-containing protein 3 [Triplophysa rosa]KAI7807585.1 putative THUMP domain-containing protein 3 [Triplophysa rosa]
MMQELNETVTIGATVPTGFELTSAEEIQEKLEATARVNKDRGKVYFDITSDKLSKVHNLRSVDHLFVVVKQYDNYQFKVTKEEVQLDLQELAAKLSWTSALEVWKMNNSLKKKKGRRKGTNSKKSDHSGNVSTKCTTDTVPSDPTSLSEDLEALQVKNQTDVSHPESGPQTEKLSEDQEALPLKFRVTCNRAGDNHCFTSNDAARDFGGAVQDLFRWKADMTKFDIEVLLNIHNEEVVIGIALTEVSLHRRNITHFGPTTLRPTLAYGMLRLCKPQPSDVILDPMCGSGAIPLEGAIEWPNSFFLAGDNNGIAINRTVNNVKHLLKNRPVERSSSGLPIDIIQWDLCNLSVRNSSVDIIITDMPFGKRMGSRKKNWDLYPLCLREMARVCKPDTGRAVLLTQDKKCFTKAVLQMGELWRRCHTAWVNVGGLRAGVFVLQRTGLVFGTTSGDVKKPHKETESQKEDMEDKSL